MKNIEMIAEILQSESNDLVLNDEKKYQKKIFVVAFSKKRDMKRPNLDSYARETPLLIGWIISVMRSPLAPLLAELREALLPRWPM
jgi:hypothetical protein